MIDFSSDASAYPNGIPEVYMQWRLQRRQPVREAFLSLSLGPRPGELMSAAAVSALMGGNLASPSHDRSVSLFSLLFNLSYR